MIDLEVFKTILKKEVKIDLFAYKDEQLNRRLKNFFLKNQITNAEAYVAKLKISEQERIKFLDHVTINVTEFFRNPDLFKELEKTIREKNKPSLKIWSAACSNGCEPYTLAILLAEMGITNYSILATDIDPTILSKAKAGEYDEIDIKNVTPELRKKYFTKEGRKNKVIPALKKNITFERHDLLMDEFPKGFDIILCRNVVIYFNAEAKDKLYKNFGRALAREGLFFVGATENIHNFQEFSLDKLSAFIYKKK